MLTTQRRSKRLWFTISILAAILTTLLIILYSCTASPPKVERNAEGDRIAQSTLKNPRLWNWELVEVIDDKHLRIKFWTQPEPSCERHRVQVIEGSEAVTIVLLAGHLPDAERFCKKTPIISSDDSNYETMLIGLKDPIGKRELIDGGRQIYNNDPAK